MQILRSLASWVLALLLVAMYLHITLHPWPDPPVGHVQLYDLPGQNILFATLAERSGYVMFEPTGRFVVAILELLTAFLHCYLSPANSAPFYPVSYCSEPSAFTCQHGWDTRYRHLWLLEKRQRMVACCSP